MAYGTALPGVSSPAVTAATYDAWFERPWGRYAFAIESRAVCDALGPVEGRAVLDAGCGTGRFSLVLAQAGARVVGVDHDMDALRIAARRAGAVACGDVAALPFADETFDACVAFTLCEFVDRPDRVVEELVRVTRSGGVVAELIALGMASVI
jgi:ubiquinone/menaquinone biosynthesis C-methylase UbiE